MTSADAHGFDAVGDYLKISAEINDYIAVAVVVIVADTDTLRGVAVDSEVALAAENEL